MKGLGSIKKFFSRRGVFSFIALIAIVYTYYNQINIRQQWLNKPTIVSDAFWYYEYLPLAFIKKDMRMSFLDDPDPGINSSKFWWMEAPNGAKVSKVTYGLALLYSPFFFGAYLYSDYTDRDMENGYSYTFQRFLYLCGFFYFVIGMLFLWLILKKYFPDIITALGLAAVALGTNLLYYTQYESLMAHAPGFALINAGIYLTIRIHEKPKLINAILLGLVFGIMLIVRPINILFCILPFLYKIKDRESLRWKLAFLREHWYFILIIAVCSFLVYLPQLIYWKNITGQWLYYSYTGEKFFFTKPALLQTLISYRKGWFIYTPIMFFAFAGLFFLRKRLPEWWIPLTAFVLINVYVISSWWCWWYGGGFGLRAFIDIYGPMTMLLCAFIYAAFKKSKWLVLPWFPIIAGAIILNLYQTYQYKWMRIHWDGMTGEAYWAIFATNKVPGDSWAYYTMMLDPLTGEDYDAARAGERFW